MSLKTTRRTTTTKKTCSFGFSAFLLFIPLNFCVKNLFKLTATVVNNSESEFVLVVRWIAFRPDTAFADDWAMKMKTLPLASDFAVGSLHSTSAAVSAVLIYVHRDRRDY